jgi:predicted RecB family nuclease
MVSIKDVEGIGEISARKLRWAGIETTEALLERGATPRGRRKIAARTGLSSKRILEWVNHVDLFRIPGVGEEYAELLEQAGVDTVVELSHRDPGKLREKIEIINDERQLVRRLPSESRLGEWIEEAKKLPRIVKY